jgi:hypothetical protein
MTPQPTSRNRLTNRAILDSQALFTSEQRSGIALKVGQVDRLVTAD